MTPFYRAWLIKQKCFVNVNRIEFLHNEMYIYFDAVKLFPRIKINSWGRTLPRQTITMAKASEFILEEQLSLTDKNNKPLFIGDIFKYTAHSGYNLESFTADVMFDSESAAYGFCHNDCFYPFNAHDELQEDLLSYCEIIGDIHQNSKLLEENT